MRAAPLQAYIFGDAFAANFLDLLDEGKIDAVLINHIAAGIGAGGDFTPELQDFFHRVDGHVARSGNDCTLALNVMALRGQHLLHEIDRAKTRGLRARTGTAIDKAFSGQNARFITIGDALVLAEHIADFTPAYADVPSRHVRSEEQPSELQSLMRPPDAVFCLNKKKA